jgi:hypothetical protein
VWYPLSETEGGIVSDERQVSSGSSVPIPKLPIAATENSESFFGLLSRSEVDVSIFFFFCFVIGHL